MYRICSVCSYALAEDNSSCPSCGNFEAVLSTGLSNELSRHLLMPNNQETLLRIKQELAEYLGMNLGLTRTPPKIEMRYKVPRKLKRSIRKPE